MAAIIVRRSQEVRGSVVDVAGAAGEEEAKSYSGREYELCTAAAAGKAALEAEAVSAGCQETHKDAATRPVNTLEPPTSSLSSSASF